MTKPDHLLDKTLKVSPTLFPTVCFPLRVAFSAWLIFGTVQTSHLKYLSFVLLGLAVAFAYKWHRNAASWKNYARPITLYTLVGAVFIGIERNWINSTNAVQMCGMILLVDALLGQECNYIAETYFVG